MGTTPYVGNRGDVISQSDALGSLRTGALLVLRMVPANVSAGHPAVQSHMLGRCFLAGTTLRGFGDKPR